MNPSPPSGPFRLWAVSLNGESRQVEVIFLDLAKHKTSPPDF